MKIIKSYIKINKNPTQTNKKHENHCFFFGFYEKLIGFGFFLNMVFSNPEITWYPLLISNENLNTN